MTLINPEAGVMTLMNPEARGHDTHEFRDQGS